MGPSEKGRQTKPEPRPHHEGDRLDVESAPSPPSPAAGHPSAYARRSRFAQALLEQGHVEAAIDELNAAIAISDQQVDAQFLMARGLIDRGRLDEAVRALRQASRIRLHKAIMRYALESAYYDHSAIELAMDEWGASLGLRSHAGMSSAAEGRVGSVGARDIESVAGGF